MLPERQRLAERQPDPGTATVPDMLTQALRTALEQVVGSDILTTGASEKGFIPFWMRDFSRLGLESPEGAAPPSSCGIGPRGSSCRWTSLLPLGWQPLSLHTWAPSPGG